MAFNWADLQSTKRRSRGLHFWLRPVVQKRVAAGNDPQLLPSYPNDQGHNLRCRLWYAQQWTGASSSLHQCAELKKFAKPTWSSDISRRISWAAPLPSAAISDLAAIGESAAVPFSAVGSSEITASACSATAVSCRTDKKQWVNGLIRHLKPFKSYSQILQFLPTSRGYNIKNPERLLAWKACLFYKPPKPRNKSIFPSFNTRSSLWKLSLKLCLKNSKLHKLKNSGN